MPRTVALIIATLAAGIVAARIPCLRELIAAVVIGSVLIAGTASFGACARAAARRAYVLALDTQREIRSHL